MYSKRDSVFSEGSRSSFKVPLGRKKELDLRTGVNGENGTHNVWKHVKRTGDSIRETLTMGGYNFLLR